MKAITIDTAAPMADQLLTAAQDPSEPVECPYYHGPVWDAFGLTRASYLVVPRRTLQSMPLEWQQQFVALMKEAHSHLPADAFPEYTVRRKDNGKFVVDPLRDYRHTGPIAPKDSSNG